MAHGRAKGKGRWVLGGWNRDAFRRQNGRDRCLGVANFGRVRVRRRRGDEVNSWHQHRVSRRGRRGVVREDRGCLVELETVHNWECCEPMAGSFEWSAQSRAVPYPRCPPRRAKILDRYQTLDKCDINTILDPGIKWHIAKNMDDMLWQGPKEVVHLTLDGLKGSVKKIVLVWQRGKATVVGAGKHRLVD